MSGQIDALPRLQRLNANDAETIIAMFPLT